MSLTTGSFSFSPFPRQVTVEPKDTLYSGIGEGVRKSPFDLLEEEGERTAQGEISCEIFRGEGGVRTEGQ